MHCGGAVLHNAYVFCTWARDGHAVRESRVALRLSFFAYASPDMDVRQSNECRTITATPGSLNLKQALERLMTADGNATASNCTSIELSPGEHVLSSQALFTAELGALEIRRTREEYVSVVCRYNVETNFTWYILQRNFIAEDSQYTV